MVEDAQCRCCGRGFRRDSWHIGTVDYDNCDECADNKVYGAECIHDTLPERQRMVE